MQNVACADGQLVTLIAAIDYPWQTWSRVTPRVASRGRKNAKSSLAVLVRCSKQSKVSRRVSKVAWQSWRVERIHRNRGRRKIVRTEKDNGLWTRLYGTCRLLCAEPSHLLTQGKSMIQASFAGGRWRARTFVLGWGRFDSSICSSSSTLSALLALVNQVNNLFIFIETVIILVRKAHPTFYCMDKRVGR